MFIFSGMANRLVDIWECPHEKCTKTFTVSRDTHNAAWRLKRHVETIEGHLDCSDACPGCLKSERARLVARVTNHVETVMSVSVLKSFNLVAGNLDLTTWGQEMRNASLSEIQREMAAQRNKERVDYFLPVPFLDTLNLIPPALRELLQGLLGNDKLKAAAVAAIFLKSVCKKFVSSFHFKATNFLNAAGLCAKLKFLSRLGISATYTYLAKVRKAVVSKKDEYTANCIDQMKDTDIVVTTDNVQKGVATSRVGRGANTTVKICMSTILYRLGGDPIQGERLPFSLDLLVAPSLQRTTADVSNFSCWRNWDYLLSKVPSKQASAQEIENTRRKAMVANTLALPAFDGNPATAAELEGFARQLDSNLLEHRKWLFLVCDGSPFLGLRRLQLEGRLARWCLSCGLLHEEMKWMENIALLYDSVGILKPACQILLQNPDLIIKRKDTHKTRVVLHTTVRALQRSLVLHLGGELEASALLCNGLQIDKIPEDRDRSWTIFLSSLVDAGLALILFYEGVRNADPSRVMLSRRWLYPLLFAFHCYKYSNIVADETCLWDYGMSHPEFGRKLWETCFLSASGNPTAHQGRDAAQEEINRAMLKYVTMKRDVRENSEPSNHLISH